MRHAPLFNKIISSSPPTRAFHWGLIKCVLGMPTKETRMGRPPTSLTVNGGQMESTVERVEVIGYGVCTAAWSKFQDVVVDTSIRNTTLLFPRIFSREKIYYCEFPFDSLNTLVAIVHFEEEKRQIENYSAEKIIFLWFFCDFSLR